MDDANRSRSGWDDPALSQVGPALHAPSEPRPLGRGGESVVLAGPDRRLPRDVAWKVARADDPAGQHRLAHEARVLAMLEHPSIVPVYDLTRGANGELRLALKEIRGHTLGALIPAPDVPGSRDGAARRPGRSNAPRAREPRLVRHLLAAAEALAWAHARGVVHRDVKPDNLMVGAFGETQVIDWSLAQIDSDPSTYGPPGALFGTPRTMSPEQARGESVGPPTDVWALGATLFEIVVGRPLQAEGDAATILARLRSGTAPDLSPARATMAPELFAILERALAVEPEDRYPDARPFADDLAAFIDGRVVSAHSYSGLERVTRFIRRWRLPLAVGATLAGTLAVAGTIAFIQIQDERDLAVAASEERRQALIAAGIANAQRELEAGRRAEAEQAAAEVLALEDRPEARGVLAATARGAHLRYDRGWPLPARGGCFDLDVSPDAQLVFCGGRDHWQVSRLEGDGALLPLRAVAEPYREARLTDRGLWVAHHDATLEWIPLVPGAPAGRRDPGCGGPIEVSGERLLDHRWGCVARAEPGQAPALAQVCAASDIQTVALDARGIVALCRDGAVDRLGLDTVSGGGPTPLPSPLGSPSRDYFSSILDRASGPGRLLIGSTRGVIVALDLASGAEVARTQLRSERMVRRLAFAPDSTVLVVEVDGDGATLLDRRSLEVVGELPAALRVVRVADDARIMTRDQRLVAWAIDGAALIGLDGLVGVTSLALWGDDALGVTHSSSALILDAATGVRAAAVSYPSEAGIAKGLLRAPAGPYLGIALDPNGENTRARRSEVGALTFTPLPATRRLVSLDPHGDHPLGADPPAQGGAAGEGRGGPAPSIASAGSDEPQRPMLWARGATGGGRGLVLGLSRSGEVDRTVTVFEDRPVDLAGDGRWLAALRVDPAQVSLFEVSDDASFKLVASCEDALATSVGVVTVDGAPRLLSTRPGAVRVFGPDCVTRALYATPEVEPVRVVGTREGLVIAGTRSGAVWAWDASGRLRARITLHREPVTALAVDPLGRWAISGAWDGRVRFFDLETLTAPTDGLVARGRAWTTTPR